MNLTLRLIHMLVRALWAARRPADPLGTFRLKGHVWPTDLDWNGHMTNSRYLSVLDLGRVDMLIRSGLYVAFRRMGGHAVVSHMAIRYRRELKPLSAFTQETRVLCWEGDTLWFEQRLIDARGITATLAIVRNTFREQGGKPGDAAALLGTAGVIAESPPIPEVVRAQMASEAALKALTAGERRAAA